ncbi:MAG: hypothetical protein QOJ35_3074 [Solirubrobacteraceae bacterium]|jgi:hypothetical protein|nr:hypothetical protein [Solirubrobacteraceae bacterium]
MQATRAIAALATSALLAAGCGQGHDRPVATMTYAAHGLTVVLPPGWQHAKRSLTPDLADPREVLALATYPLRYRRTGCAHVASSALEDLGPRDAFVTLQERGLDPRSSWRGFPRRPARFAPRLGGPSEASACVPRARFSDHWFAFSDGGRHFHVDVAFGPRASAVTRRQAWAILDGLRVDPRVRPDWTSSG